MYTLEFKLTFNLTPDDFDGDDIEDMRTLDYSSIKRGNLRCFFDWAKYAHDKKYIGFNDKEVSIEVSDKGSFGQVTVASELPFDKIVKTYLGSIPLKEAIVNYMNAQISDGIGENEVGYAKYNGNTYSVWINSLNKNVIYI